MNKYDMLVEMAKAFDERDMLRLENDRQQKLLHEYKIAEGSGVITPQVTKLVEYAKRALFEKCCPYPDSIEVHTEPEHPDTPVPNEDFADWFKDAFRTSYVPDNFSVDEAREFAESYALVDYQNRVDKAVASWKYEREYGEGDD